MKSNEISDGFGNSWEKCKLGTDCGLHVVRPGKARCWCQDQEASRVEIQAAREEIAKLEDDNERLRELVSTLGAPNHVGVPVEQWKALREDKARLIEAAQLALDTIVCGHRHGFEPNSGAYALPRLRAAIDAARKETQP